VRGEGSVAMTTDGWWRDDAQVVAGEVRKFYHAKGDVPGAEIGVRQLGARSSNTRCLQGVGAGA